MSAFLRHYRARLTAVVRRPGAVLPLLLYGALTLMFWPGAVPRGDSNWSYGFLLAHWVFLWPVFAMAVSCGRSTSSASSGAFGMLDAMPALPIGPRVRVLADVAVVLSFVFAFQLPVLALGYQLSPYGVPEPAFYGGLAAYFGPLAFLVAGAAVLVPLMVNWAAPGRGLGLRWLTQIGAVTGVLLLAWIGWLATPGRAILTGLLLTTVSLAALRMKPPERALRKGRMPVPDSLYRPWMPPESRLRRDGWELLLKRTGAGILILLLAELIALVADQLFVLPEYALYLASTVVFGFFFSYVLLRPMGDPLASAGALGAPGFKPGDFARAWSVLPVRRESLARGVYLHGLLCGGAIYGGILLVNVLSTWRDTGRFGLSVYENSSSGWVLLPLAACIPCLVGFVTCAAMGDRVLPYLCFGIAIGTFFVEVALHILGAPLWVLVITVFVLALFGGLAPVGHMIAPRPARVPSGKRSRQGSSTSDMEGCATDRWQG